MLKIVSHTRTGTHLLAMLLFRNFKTGATDYEELHYSHSRIPAEPYIHLYRPVLPVMLSVWRNREHLGVHRSVSFSDMIRTPWADMRKATSCEAVFNGKRWDRVCPPHPFQGTMLDRWLSQTLFFAARAEVSVRYYDVVSRPLMVLNAVEQIFRYERLPFSPVLERVGWWPAEEETPEVTGEDVTLMEKYQRCLNLP